MSEQAKKYNVIELPVGEYGPIRTLRHALGMAERGEIDDVVLVCQKTEDDDTTSLFANWSDAERRNVLWMTRWLDSFINHRYFNRYHGD